MIRRDSMAGSLESNDIMVEIHPNQNGIEIELNSPVADLFGEQILKVAHEVLKEYNVENIKLILNDKGALDYTIRARIITALQRGVNNG